MYKEVKVKGYYYIKLHTYPYLIYNMVCVHIFFIYNFRHIFK